MASTYIRDWFRAELAAWDTALPPGDPLHAPFVETLNTKRDLTGAPPQFVTLAFVQPSIHEAVSIGNPGCKRESGRVDVVCAVRAGVEADRPATLIADAVAAWFRERAQRLSVSPVRDLRTLVPDPPATVDDGDGRYFLAFVGVEYRCDSYV